MMTNAEKAAALAEMMRAHQIPSGLPAYRVWGCNGIKDPLTSHYCQYRGTPQEQYAHLQQRLVAVLDSFDEQEGRALLTQAMEVLETYEPSGPVARSDEEVAALLAQVVPQGQQMILNQGRIEPYRPGMRRSDECEQAHLDRHTEIGSGCSWPDTASLNDGCPIRYRIYKEHLGLPTGHSFGPWAEGHETRGESFEPDFYCTCPRRKKTCPEHGAMAMDD